METLKLHHIAPYLPYELKCQTVDRGEVVISELNAAYSDNSYTFMNIVESEKGFDDIKPLLKPMSALNISYVSELARYVSTLDEKYTIEIAMKMIEERKSKPLNMPYVIVQILLQWHFDVFGLIDKGLAKNILELETEKLNIKKMEVQKTKYKVVVDGQVSNIEIDLHNFTIIENRKVGRIIHHFPPSTKLSEFHEMLNEIIEFNFNENGRL